MSLARIATRLPSAAAWVVTHPLETTGRAVGFAKGAVVGGVAHVDVLKKPVPEQRSTDASPARPPARPSAGPSAGAAQAEPTRTEPTRVAPTPAPPAEPPVDVVEQALAAEAAGEDLTSYGGPATEPHPVTREEIHGEAPLVREERDEIEEETDEGLGLLGEDDLPADGPVLDPAVAKTVRTEHLRTAGQEPD